MKGGWMLLLLAAATVGSCRPEPDERAPVSGEPRPDRTGPMRPPGAHIEGNYVLTTVSGTTVPAVLGATSNTECHEEIIDATLRLEAGRFAFQNRVREVCGTTAREPVVHAAGGSYSLDGDSIILEADLGGAFTRARATAGETQLVFHELSSDGATRTVSWLFQRLGPELVPQEGATDRTDQPPP
jgi:hypothetical protein